MTTQEIFAANQVLTVDIAKSLFGKRIQTVYSGYRGQDGGDNFVVGEIKREIYATGKEGEVCLFTIDGRNTFIRAHSFNNGVFTCSDSDREVYYVLIDKFQVDIAQNSLHCEDEYNGYTDFNTYSECIEYIKSIKKYVFRAKIDGVIVELNSL